MSELDQLEIDLQVVGQLRSSDKLGVLVLPGSTRLVVDGGSYAQPFYRWWNGSSRDASMDYLAALVQRCQNTAVLVVEGRLVGMAQSLSAAALRAIEGLKNLQSTYSSDSATVARIGLAVAKLEAVVEQVARAVSEAEPRSG